MNRHFLSLLAMVMLGVLSTPLHAQPTESEAAYVLPWHRLYGGRAPSTFSSIVGLSGTTKISGSSAASPFDPAFSIPLPFSVKFLDSLYPAGHTVKAGVAGFLSFNSSVTLGTAPYLLMPHPVYNRMLMPFWGEFGTSGGTNQGIYHRVTIDPILYDTIWTVEWRVETVATPNDDGAFQLQIVKRPAFVGATNPRFEFRFNYDATSTMAMRSVPGSFGAQVGIKDLGQPVGYPPAPTSGVPDDAYYMLMTRGSLFSNTPAITRLRTRYQSAHYTPDWYAPWEGSVSSFFHFTLPDSMLKMKPIDIDVEAMLRLPMATAYVIPPGGPRIRTSEFTNRGNMTLYQVPVAVFVFNGQLAIDSTIAWIDSLLPGQSRNVQFNIPSLQPGIYRVMAVARYASDENRMNDSTSRMLYVRPESDAMPLEILSPALGPASCYLIDSAIPIQVNVLGVGTQAPSKLYYSYTIIGQTNQIMASVIDSAQVPGLAADSMRTITLGQWTPQLPGSYYVNVNVAAAGDQLPGNNLLASLQSADWRAGGSAPFTPAPVPFRVYVREDLATGNHSRYPHHPFRNTMVVNQTPVRIYFLNNGGLAATGVTGRVVIKDQQENVVYDNTSGNAIQLAAGEVRELVFPPFTVQASGGYSLRAYLQHQASDTIHDNDTADWLFMGVVDTSGGPKLALAPHRGYRAEVAPNPVAGVARLSVTPADGPVRVIVTDLRGVEVLRLERARGEESLPIDMSGEPGGLYLVRVELDGQEPMILPLVVVR